MQNQNNIPGFSLVEMSVVLVIIGLITAGIVTSIKLVNISKLRVVIAEYNRHEVAILRFKDKFSYPPGDFPKANQYWSAASPGNGNGSFSVGMSICGGNIATAGNKEDVKAWKHLELAGLTEDISYLGDCVSGKMVLGQSVPGSKVNNHAGYWLLYTNGDYYGHPAGNILQFGLLTTNGLGLEGGALTPQDARSIDQKIDDGIADSGSLLAKNGDGFSKISPNACVNGDLTDNSASYILSNSDETCAIFYYINN